MSKQAAPVAQRRRHGFWHSLKLVTVTATVTSAAWVVGLAMNGGSLFSYQSPSRADAPVSFQQGAAPLSLSQQAQSRSAVAAPGIAASPGGLRIPVEGIATSALVDTFDAPRGERRHEALDIIAPLGTPVVAAAAGRLEKLFVSEAGGNTIYVRSPDGARMFYYAHLDTYAPGLKEGDFVNAGQRIGTVGISGNADPAVPHLHFQILRMMPADPWWKGTPENPYPLLTAPKAPRPTT